MSRTLRFPALTKQQENVVSVLAQSQIEREPEKSVRISPRMKQAIHLLATGSCKTQRAAAERVNMTETHLSRMLARPQIQALMTRETRKVLMNAQLPAANTLVRLLDASSEHVQRETSVNLLRISGHIADDNRVAVNVDVRAGFVIDLSEPPQQRGSMVESEAVRQNTLRGKD
jgi:hypothetical protein